MDTREVISSDDDRTPLLVTELQTRAYGRISFILLWPRSDITSRKNPSRTHHDIRDLSKEPISTPALLLLSRLLLLLRLLLPRPEREPRIDLLLLLLLLPIRSRSRSRSEDAPTRFDRRQGRDRGERVVRVFIVGRDGGGSDGWSRTKVHGVRFGVPVVPLPISPHFELSSTRLRPGPRLGYGSLANTPEPQVPPVHPHLPALSLQPQCYARVVERYDDIVAVHRSDLEVGERAELREERLEAVLFRGREAVDHEHVGGSARVTPSEHDRYRSACVRA
jgi:hypothetical protein